MTETPLQTAEGRLEALRQVAVDFSTHLETVPGAYLPPDLRLGVATCARNALTCKACAELQQSCLPKSVSFYLACSNVNHDKGISFKSNNKVASCLTSIVHALVNQQPKLNQAWFDDAIQAIKESGLVSENIFTNEEGVELACYSAFAEIVALASVSSGLYEAFVALNQATPLLPTKAAPGPTNIDFSSLLKRVRRDENLVAMPYFMISDVDTSSSEWMKLRESTREKLQGPTMLNDKSPMVGLCMAPEDLFMFDHFMSVAYMKAGFVRTTTCCESLAPLFFSSSHIRNVFCLQKVAMTWIPLDSSIYCPSVSRHDLETVASAIAAAHECNF